MGKIHPDAEQFFAWHPECRSVVQPFLSSFDVTRAQLKTRGGDRLAVIYLKAEPHIAELVGLEREMMLAYAPFPEFQARTVKLHDEAYSEDRIRLDPIGTILVTDDPATSSRVGDFVKSEPERAPIVAVSSQSLARVTDVVGIRALLFEQLYQRDLFALESPLRTDTTFFGREAVVSELLDRFRSGQNSGLFGLRRIGKTSVLYALGRRAEIASIAGSAYLDMSNPSAYRARWWEVLQRIVRAFAEPLDLQRGERSKVRALTLEYAEKDGAKHFRADLMHLATKLPGGRILLMLDEVEHVTFDISPVAHWSTDFLPLWQAIRSVHQDSKGAFGFIVAGVNPHAMEADRVGNFDNPLFATTKPIYLGPFEIDDVRQMVRRISRYMGLRCDEGLYQRLTEEYGGHPYLVRHACSHLARKVDVRPGELSAAMFEREREHIAVALERNVRQILNVLAIWYPDEYELLRILAQGDRKTFVDFARHSASFTEHVEGYGLVRDARGDPRLRIGLVRQLLTKAEVSLGDAGEDEEAVLSEISRRRNGVEVGLRGVLRDGLRFHVGKKAADSVLKALTEERRAIVAQFGYEGLWSELYFSELIAILKRNWDAFQTFLAADQTQVMQWLEQINRCRADAHAKQLSGDDLAFLRVSLRRMEEMLGVVPSK